MKKVYLICPVARIKEDPELEKKLWAYVNQLEKSGYYKVHFPLRKSDVDQNDPTGGAKIMEAHSRAMIEADEAHIWYDETSGGSKCDIGMMYILIALGHKKKIVIINEEEAAAADKKKKKSYLKVIQHLKASQ